MTSPPVRVLVVDDHTLFRRGIQSLLRADARLAVVGEAADATQALRLAAELQPQVILLDNHMPGASGVQALPGLRECAPQAQVLMLTMSEDEHDLAAALRAGARGYLLKTADAEVLCDAIVGCARGEFTVSPELTGKLIQAMQAPPPCPQPAPPKLSPREEEILAQIALGQSNKQIARTLSIAETTVKIHVQHILRKLQLVSRVQAAVYASRHSAGAASVRR